MLTAYRSTPHPAHKKTPYQLMMNRDVRIRLDHYQDQKESDFDVRTADGEYKQKMKKYADGRRRAKSQNFKPDDYVLVKQTKRNKLTSAFEPAFYRIVEINGSQIKSRRIRDGRTICRDASMYKPVNEVIQSGNYPDDIEDITDDLESIIDIEDSTTDTHQQESATAAGDHGDMSAGHGNDVHTPAAVPNMPDGSAGTIPPMRRSQRNRQVPRHLQDYVTR